MLRSLFMYILCFIACATLYPFISTAAEADSKDTAIFELLKVMKTMDNMETSLESMKDTIKMNTSYFIKEIEEILARDLDGKDVQLAADKYRNNEFGPTRLYELFRNKFNLERFKKEVMLPVYKEHYTEDEINQLITFYKSDLGQKTLQLTPTISRSISSKTRDISKMAIDQAKEELALELKKSLEN